MQSFDCYTLFTKKPSLLKKFFLFLSCARFASDFLFSFQRPLSASFDADQHTGSLSRTFIVTERASAGNLVGSSGFEPPTLRLSGARSNHLSYEPILMSRFLMSRSSFLQTLCVSPAIFSLGISLVRRFALKVLLCSLNPSLWWR